jgi:protein-S-isoprenylcysteine O-methyltransferase Ste14
MTERDDTPGVRFPPPLIFLLGLGAGLSLSSLLFPMPVVDAPLRPVLHVRAGLFGLASLALLLSALGGFRRKGNDPRPWREDTAFVEDGIYRHTRNPMYVGMALAYVAITLAFNSYWPFLALVPVLVVIHYYVIAREEAYLAERFGQTYLDYCTRVRRWL